MSQPPPWQPPWQQPPPAQYPPPWQQPQQPWGQPPPQPVPQRQPPRFSPIVIILGFILAILVVVIPLYWSQISHLFLGLEPSCTIGVTGTNATLTIQAWDADSACQQWVDQNNAQHPGQYYIFTGETNAPVLREVDMQGRHYTMRDQGIFDLVGNTLCKGLEGQGSTPNPATDVANKYYTAIQSQDYATAYSYLDASSITFTDVLI